MLKISSDIDTTKYDIGVCVARFQTNTLTQGHKALLDLINYNHDYVIVFLGVPVIENTRRNPLNFAMREMMVKDYLPNAIVLPIKDQRNDLTWSNNLDAAIKLPFGDKKAILYGSRDSFIPYYRGSYEVIEVKSTISYSGSELREGVSKVIINSDDFRRGMIYATYGRRPVTYATVDLAIYNKNDQILLAKKPNENLYRFIGGFVDRTDLSWEFAAKREGGEEANGIELGKPIYVASGIIDDWRYKGAEDGIMTTLFMVPYIYGNVKATDDIAVLDWINNDDLISWKKGGELHKYIMPEHIALMEILITKLENQ